MNNIDNVKNAINRFMKRKNLSNMPSPKKLRKTSANLIFNKPEFRTLASLFLGHAPSDMKEVHYVSNDDTTLDSAIKYLGEQYGIE